MLSVFGLKVLRVWCLGCSKAMAASKGNRTGPIRGTSCETSSLVWAGCSCSGSLCRRSLYNPGTSTGEQAVFSRAVTWPSARFLGVESFMAERLPDGVSRHDRVWNALSAPAVDPLLVVLERCLKGQGSAAG